MDVNKGLAKDVAALKINVANMPAKIVSGVNALGNQLSRDKDGAALKIGQSDL